MLVLRGLDSPDDKPLALTIGNFDGMHLGHQALLDQLQAEAGSAGLASAAMIFEPHPREFFSPHQAPARLTSLREKLELFAARDLNRVYACRFDWSFAALSAADFIFSLHRNLHVKFVLIGDDFRFGKGRSGDLALIRKMGLELGFAVKSMPSILMDGERISSTSVRTVLAQGDLQTACRYLGRPYRISGRVVHGAGLGKGLGFPTANIQLKHNFPPLSGIFVVQMQGDGLPPTLGAASLGVRPTVLPLGKPVLEVHLPGYSGDLYGRHVCVDFLHKLRDEQKYPDLEALRQQIARDVEEAGRWSGENGRTT